MSFYVQISQISRNLEVYESDHLVKILILKVKENYIKKTFNLNFDETKCIW